MALAVNQTEEEQLNWADFIDGLRYGTEQRAPSRRDAQPGAPIPAPPDGAARDAGAQRIAPQPRSS